MTPVDTTASVGSLAPGERAPFAFEIEVSDDATAGHRQFTLQPSFRTVDGNQRAGSSIDVRVPIEEEIDRFDVAVREATVEQGQSAEVTVAVTNNGTEPVRRVSAQLFADSPISTTDKRAYVDALSPGEETELTFEIAAGNALPKAYPMSVDFEYENADGETELSETYSLATQVVPPEDNGPPMLAVLLGAGLLLALVGGAVVWRRR